MSLSAGVARLSKPPRFSRVRPVSRRPPRLGASVDRRDTPQTTGRPSCCGCCGQPGPAACPGIRIKRGIAVRPLALCTAAARGPGSEWGGLARGHASNTPQHCVPAITAAR
jgi:hypothetical protein